MKKDNEEIRYLTPSQMLKSFACLHAFALDCFEDRSLRRQESVAERLVKDEGMAFQDAVIDSLPGRRSAEGSYQNLEQGRATTERWLREGADWICQGVLVNGDLCGIPDLLKRVPVSSRLGDYAYQPVEIKSHRHASFYDRLQLFFYACLLEPVLGFRPATGMVMGPDGFSEEVWFSPRLERQFFDMLEKMREVRAGRVETKPYRCAACQRCLWFPVCTRVWSESDHVSLLSGVSALMARRLDEQGVRTCREVAQTPPAKISEFADIPLGSATRIVESARARVEGRPLIRKPPVFPRDETVYYYDIETLDDQVFCHGIIRVHRGQKEERCFFAETPDDEARIWHEFLDFLAEAPSATLYCWTFYEKTFVESSWRRFGGNRDGYEMLRRSLTDQCAFVKDHFILPCRGYSIKVVAPYFGFRWRSKDANGMNCVAWYKHWLETRDESWRQKIMEYNLDDVRAMVLVDEKLRELVRA